MLTYLRSTAVGGGATDYNGVTGLTDVVAQYGLVRRLPAGPAKTPLNSKEPDSAPGPGHIRQVLALIAHL